MSMDMENMLQSVLANPETMEKIMAMAQSLGASSAPPPPPPKQDAGGFEMPDMEMLQKMAAFAGKSSIDPDQRALLSALRPYIGAHRLNRLERAMQAAKMAGLATGLMQKSF